MFLRFGAAREAMAANTIWNEDNRNVEWFDLSANPRLSTLTSRTHHQAARSSPRWQPPDLKFRATLDEIFIELESSLKAEILMGNLPSYNLFVAEKKKNYHFGMNFSFNSEKYVQQCQNCSQSILSITMMLLVGTLNWSVPSPSSPEASLSYIVGRLGRKKKENPLFPLPIVRHFLFFDYFYFNGIPGRLLCKRERCPIKKPAL